MLTPEQKAALMALLNDGAGGPPAKDNYSGTASGPEHPDASQDYDEICLVMEQKLTPAFEMIGTEFKKLNDQVSALQDVVYKLITSFSDGISGHRMNTLRSNVLPKYADDLGTYGPMAKDLLGDDIEQKLLDALMAGDGDPDEIANGVLSPYKEKFSKYTRVPEATVASVEVAPAEGEKPEEEPAEAETTEEPVAEDKQIDLIPDDKDPVRAMMRKLESVKGPRKTA